MNAFHVLLPGLIAGIVSIFTSWFWMGFVFHRFQKRTPNTWRRESGISYALSSALHVLAAIAIAALFTIVTRAQTPHFPLGLHGALLFGFVCWGVFVLPIILEGAVFINPSVSSGRTAVGLAFDFASRDDRDSTLATQVRAAAAARSNGPTFSLSNQEATEYKGPLHTDRIGPR